MGALLKEVWDFLKDEENRNTLAAIGGAVAVLIASGWKIYTHFYPKPDPKKLETPPLSPPAPVITNSATGGNVTIYNHHVTCPEEADRKHLELLAAIAQEKGFDPKFLTPLFEAAGQDPNINPEQFETAIRTAVEALRSRSNNPVQPSNDGADIDAAIRAARQKLSDLDIEGALTILRTRDNEEAALVQARNRGRASLKCEEAAIYKRSFRYDEAITALDEATALDPEDFWALIELGDIHWEVLRKREPALAAFGRAEALAKQNGFAQDEGIALDRKGDVLAKSDPASARKAYEDSLAIAKVLCEGDKANSRNHRYLSVSHSKIGDILAVSDPATALKHYRDSFAISKALSEGDKSNNEYLRDLSVCNNKIGNMLAKSNPAAALEAYQESLAIAKALAEGDVSNWRYQKDLSLAYNNIGNILANSNPAAALEAYQDALTINKALADADNANKEYQRDMYISYSRIGDMLAKSDPATALNIYQYGLVIGKALAEEENENREYQRDLSITYEKIGNVLAANDPAAALKAYQDSLTIRKALAEVDNANRDYQRGLAVSYAKIAELGHNPFENWGKVHEILASLRANRLIDSVDEWMVEHSRAKRDAAT